MFGHRDVARPWRRARKRRAHSGRPCNEALRAETWGHCSQIGHAVRARLGIAALCGAGDGRERRGAATGGRATKRCRQRIGNTVCELGIRRVHLWTSRRGARVRAAASPQSQKLERGARSALCGAAHGTLRASRAGQRPAKPLATGEKRGGPQRVAGQQSAANRDIGKPVCDLGTRHGHRWTPRHGAIVWAA